MGAKWAFAFSTLSFGLMWRHPFLKGLSVLVVLNVLVKPLWVLGIDRAVQNQLGHAVYGEYFALMNLSVALSFIADAGLTNMMNQQLAKGVVLNIGRIFWMKIILSIVYLLVIFFIALLAGIGNWSVLFYVCSIQILASFLLFFRAVITANQQFRTDAWLSVLDKSLLIFVCSFFIYGPTTVDLALDLFLQLQLASLAAALAIAGFFALKKRSPMEKKFLFSLALLRPALPFFVLVLLMSFHNRIDAFLLERMNRNGAYEAGVYASAYRLLDAANMVGYLVASFLVPFAANRQSKKLQLATIATALRNSLLLVAAVLLPIVFVFGRSVLQLLYPSLNVYPVSILQLCIAALPLYYVTHIYGSLLTANGSLKTFGSVVGVSLVLNIVLNLFLISFGAIGCTIAAFCSQFLCAAGCMFYVKRRMGLLLHLSSLILHVLLGIVVGLLLYFGDTLGYVTLSLLVSGLIAIAFLMFVTVRPLRTAFTA